MKTIKIKKDSPCKIDFHLGTGFTFFKIKSGKYVINNVNEVIETESSIDKECYIFDIKNDTYIIEKKYITICHT